MAKSFDLRNDPNFLRNGFAGPGNLGIPLVRKQLIDIDGTRLIACTDTRPSDTAWNRKKGVHFFRDDQKFANVALEPERAWPTLSQYAYLLTPDFSLYTEMDPWRQILSVALNRWCGALWQRRGALVITTVSWSTPRSFVYCFDGIEQNAIVAVSTVGCRADRLSFMRGYDAMLERLAPCAILCYGKPFEAMRGNLVVVPYERFDFQGVR